MSRPIAIFFHGLLFMGEPPKFVPNALDIITEQMDALNTSGLADAATEIHIGLNGGKETAELAQLLFPAKAKIVYHGLKSRAENLTVVMLENWVKTHPDWYCLYFHAKGCSHPPDSHYGNNVSAPWRVAMMQDLVLNWKHCVAALDTGHDIACSHWLWGMADGTQHIPAGGFLWLTSNFAAKLPSIYLRDRIKKDGIAALSSRYESEVYWGNGPKPNVKQFRPNGGGGVP